MAGEEFEFELVLVGHSVDALAYFIIAFRDLAAGGWGLNRARCELRSVEALSGAGGGAQIVFDGRDGLVRPIEPAFDASASLVRDIPPCCSQRVRVRLLTPMGLKSDGRVVRRPEFHHIFKRARDRINALATFFDSGPLDADFSGIGERAERIQTLEANYRWVELARTSSRTGQRHELSGVLGEAVFAGDVSEFLPWLAVAEWVHVGRHAAWGNGRLAFEVQAT